MPRPATDHAPGLPMKFRLLRCSATSPAVAAMVSRRTLRLEAAARALRPAWRVRVLLTVTGLGLAAGILRGRAQW